jgi:riboflavin synthase
MFTGLVELLGTVTAAQAEPPGLRLVIDAGPLSDDATMGASICVSGCCLSIVAIDGARLTFELGPETLAKTTLGRLQPGGRVNLERSLQVSDRLGGHLVTGHVDAVGRLLAREQEGDWVTCRFSADAAILRQMVPKGSITVDGVSLTVVEVTGSEFSVALIPHTLAVTTLGALAAGDPVNLETDLIGKYVTTRLEAWFAAGGGPGRGNAPGLVQESQAQREQD